MSHARLLDKPPSTVKNGFCQGDVIHPCGWHVARELGVNMNTATNCIDLNQRSWMAEHSEEIPGLDSSRPLLPQLDLLEADQKSEQAGYVGAQRNAGIF